MYIKFLIKPTKNHKENFKLISRNYSIPLFQATSSHAPPASLIDLSASRLNNFDRTTTGTFGSLPFPKTLMNPYLLTSITAAFPAGRFSAYFLCFSSRSVHNLLTLIIGHHSVFFLRWKCRIPFFPIKVG